MSKTKLGKILVIVGGAMAFFGSFLPYYKVWVVSVSMMSSLWGWLVLLTSVGTVVLACLNKRVPASVLSAVTGFFILLGMIFNHIGSDYSNAISRGFGWVLWLLALFVTIGGAVVYLVLAEGAGDVKSQLQGMVGNISQGINQFQGQNQNQAQNPGQYQDPAQYQNPGQYQDPNQYQ